MDIKPTMIIRGIDNACEAYNKAGKHREFFSQITKAIWEDADLQINYHEFAASLSEEDLGTFLIALKENPDNLAQFLDISSRLSGDALSPFLQGAALAGEDVDAYLESVDDFLEEKNGPSPAFQYAFLAAGVSRPES